MTQLRTLGYKTKGPVGADTEHEEEMSTTIPTYTDLQSKAYREALVGHLDTHRDERYGRLSETRYRALRKLVWDHPDTLPSD